MEPEHSSIPHEVIREAEPAQPDTGGNGSISDYMDYLLKTYSTKPGPKGPPEDAFPSSQSNRAGQGSVRHPSRTSEPVAAYDLDDTRSQIEALRETSNLNVASALRKASSRRRRKRLGLWIKFSVLLAGVYAAVVFLLG